jgi:uncharacterized protein YndB with AHSA1/START domain
MRSAAAQVDIAATPATLWAALTSPDQTRLWLSSLTITSAWQPGARVDAYYGSANIATGAVVVADKPSRLIYRPDGPRTGDIDCWLGWDLQETEPGITRVTLTADTLPHDPPVDIIRILSDLKTYLETGRRLPSRRRRPAHPDSQHDQAS